MSDLVRSPTGRSLRPKHTALLLPMILLLHTAEVFAAYLAPEPTTRHYWTWAWQMSPLWIGVANFVASRLIGTSYIRSSPVSSAKFLLGIPSLISGGIWVYTLLNSEHAITTVFLPDPSAQPDFALHMRRALQIDEISLFTSSYLWIIYSFFDLYLVGNMGMEWLAQVIALPVITAFIGPGAAFAVGWYWRERKLQHKVTKQG